MKILILASNPREDLNLDREIRDLQAVIESPRYVIRVSQTIQDDTAIAFSKGFDRALGCDCSTEQAFGFGKTAIQLESSASSEIF